ncbi:MAG: carboxypeptidase regulatory-like domain-containing protein [Bryobacteraceae bacterium]
MKSCLLLLVFSTALAAQSVEGDVVDGLTGAPIEGAYVSTSSANGAMLSTRTDAAGHFRFEEASPWAHLMILRAGYRFINWSLPRPFAQPSSQGISGLRITLAPEAVISGKVLDEDGFPVDNAFIMVLHYQLGNGQRQLRQVVTRLGGGIHSDDFGQFRLAGLLPGRYIIQVTPNNLRSWDSRYVPLFFPGGLQPAETELFEVKAGQQLSGIELRMAKYEGVTVTGRVVAPDGSPPPNSGPVSLSQSGIGGSQYGSWSQKDGSFSIPHVRPGNYTLGAWPGSPQKAGDLMGRQQLQVGGSDVHGILLTLHEIQPVDLTGTIVLEGGGNLHPMLINARGAGPDSVTARSEEDGSFVLKGLLPGHYFIQVRRDRKFVNGALDPESVQWAGNPVSARLGEKEVLREGFDVDGPPPSPLRITLSSHSINAHGTILDAAGRPVAGAMVMLLSSRQPITQTWSETDSNGAFWVSSQVAGEFHVFVIADQSQADLLEDCDFIEAHKQDYPPLRLIDGPNPPVTLQVPAVLPPASDAR